MSDMGRYSIRFKGHESAEGHTTYTMQVTNGESEWPVHKRYREIRDLHEELRLHLGDLVPAYPPKRFFGSLDPAFIQQRQEQLQQYMDALLRIDAAQRHPATKDFFGSPAPQSERNQERQHERILEDMQSKMLNLALPPAPLDEHEKSQRLKKYGTAMRQYVLTQPVDPIHLRGPSFDAEPVVLCHSSAEQLEALKNPTSVNDRELLGRLLDGVKEVLHPKQPLADKDKLVVPFPPCT